MPEPTNSEANATPREEPSEKRAAILASLWLFCWFASYFVQRPLRDVYGIVQGVENLPALFAISALVVLPANMLFSAVAGKNSALRVLKLVVGVVVLVLLGFAVAVKTVDKSAETWLARAFYIWVSLFSLFAISVFWGTMAQLFASERAKKWYGLMFAGGTLGGLAGAQIVSFVSSLKDRVAWLTGDAKVIAYLGISALLFILGGLLAMAIAASPFGASLHVVRENRGTKASALEGMRRCFASKYLLMICLFLVLYTFTSTAISLEKSFMMSSELGKDRDAIAKFSATLDGWTQGLTLVGQLLATSAVLRFLGVTGGLAFVPVVTILGFLGVAIHPSLVWIAVFEATRKVVEYVVTKPSREVLYTVVSREEKYQAKVFIDTFVYRIGDATGSAFKELASSLAMGSAAVLASAVPFAVVWLVVAIFLGRKQQAMAAAASARPVA